MTETDDDLIFRMWNVPCGTCARPAGWYVNGVVLPCGCGSTRSWEIANARIRARDYEARERER